MGRWWPAALLGCAAAVAVLAAAVECAVTYDKKAVMIDGQRRILFSGSIHYPRSTPDVTTFFKISSFCSSSPGRFFRWFMDVVAGFLMQCSEKPAVVFLRRAVRWGYTMKRFEIFSGCCLSFLFLSSLQQSCFLVLCCSALD